MERKEFGLLASAMRTYYPKESILPNKEAMELWFRELQDIPYPVAEAALRKWVATEKWSPTIAEIRATAANVSNGRLPDWGEGWMSVQKAFSRFGRDRKAEALASFDPITRKTVEYLGWVNLCNSTNSEMDRANFRQCFETVAKREKEVQQLALPLQEVIATLQLKQVDDTMCLIGGGNSAAD